ncbi:MAG: hypothetical protein LC708_03385, partial [Actinobacteria bacterium]|nr:hypothetical protein [Actinomycetota bacterium]
MSQDIVAHDNATGTTTLWSGGANGAQANGRSSAPAISANGAMVAFASVATNLVSGDTNAARDVFARYTTLPTPTPTAGLAGPGEAGTTTRPSVGANGAQATGATAGDRPVSSTSADGRYVAFESAATNLVGGDTNGVADIFVADRVAGTTTRVSVGTTNALGVSAQAKGPSAHPSISADGRYVAFESRAANLVALDTNGVADIFVRDRVKGTTTRMSVDGGGAESRGGDSRNPAIAVNATKVVVAFSSAATNLVAGDTNSAPNVFMRQMSTTNLSAGSNIRINLKCAKAAVQADVSRPTYFPTPAVSGDANAVAFESDAPNLVPADTNGVPDIFVYRPGRGCARVSVDNSFAQANAPSSAPALNYDASVVAFTSAATNLVGGDTNGAPDVFVRNLATAVTTR